MQLLSRLRLWQKLALLVAAMAVPTALVGWFYITTATEQVSQARLERDRARFHSPQRRRCTQERSGRRTGRSRQARRRPRPGRCGARQAPRVLGELGSSQVRMAGPEIQDTDPDPRGE